MRTLVLGSLPDVIKYFLELLIGILIVSWISASAYGSISFAISIAVLLSALFEYGFAKTALQVVPKYLVKRQYGLLKGFILSELAFILATCFIYFFASYFVYHFLHVALKNIDFFEFNLLAIIAFSLAMARFFCNTLKGKGDFILANVLQKIEPSLLWLTGILVLYLFNASWLNRMTILYAYAFSWICCILVAFYFVMRRFSNKIRYVKRETDWPHWMKVSSAYSANTLSLVVTHYTGIITLGIFTKNGQFVAIYVVIINILNLLYLMLVTSNTYFFPLISLAHTHHDITRINFILRQRLHFLGVLSILFLLIIFLFGKHFLGLYGVTFAQYHWLLMLLCIAFVVETLLGSGANIAVIFGHQRRTAVSQFLVSLLTVILSVLLVPSLGMVGAAMGYAIPKTLLSSYNAWWLYQKYDVKLFSLP